METNSLLPQLLQGTRRRIILLLRSEDRTVRELAEALDLTRNAVRSQLSNLQRDGLAQVTGRRPTERKPEYVYGLTEQAEQLFPKSYDEVLSVLLSVLAEERDDVDDLLEDVGRRLARLHKPYELEPAPQDRLERAKSVLEDMGGLPIVESENGTDRLRGERCPLASLVEAHGPLACDLARALLEELTELPLERRCQVNADGPECVFVVERE